MRHIYIDPHNHNFFTKLYLIMTPQLKKNKISIKILLCVVVVTESCLLSADKNNETLHDVDIILLMYLFLSATMHCNAPVQYPL